VGSSGSQRKLYGITEMLDPTPLFIIRKDIQCGFTLKGVIIVGRSILLFLTVILGYVPLVQSLMVFIEGKESH
jgi:hypothetical protein